MIFLYTVLITSLGCLKFLVARRATGLEKRYTRVACAVLKLAGQASLKPGSRDDFAALTAKRQFELGQLASKRDRLEAKHFFWQAWADKLGRAVERVRHWKGQKLPYTLGVVDFWLVMGLVDYLGMGQIVSVQSVVEMVRGCFGE